MIRPPTRSRRHAQFQFYTLEVVQRIGYDSFCPDNGVLLAKNKDSEGRQRRAQRLQRLHLGD